jgi:hypothetical protein
LKFIWKHYAKEYFITQERRSASEIEEITLYGAYNFTVDKEGNKSIWNFFTETYLKATWCKR